MKIFLRLLLLSILMLSPCSIKASIQQIVQEEHLAIDKTSPNKALSFDISNCEDAGQSIEKLSQKLSKQFIQPSIAFENFVLQFNFEKKLLSTQIDSKNNFQKLFILYSQLKIAAA